MSTQEKAAHPQTEQDHIERLRAMESDHGETWDLSENDQAAIRWARHQIETIDEALARRPALAEFPDRYSKVYHACEMAGRAEKSEAVNKELLHQICELPCGECGHDIDRHL